MVCLSCSIGVILALLLQPDFQSQCFITWIIQLIQQAAMGFRDLSHTEVSISLSGIYETKDKFEHKKMKARCGINPG